MAHLFVTDDMSENSESLMSTDDTSRQARESLMSTDDTSRQARELLMNTDDTSRQAVDSGNPAEQLGDNKRNFAEIGNLKDEREVTKELNEHLNEGSMEKCDSDIDEVNEELEGATIDEDENEDNRGNMDRKENGQLYKDIQQSEDEASEQQDDEDSVKDKVFDGMEVQESIAAVGGGDYGGVQVKTIDIADDDDLFDFLQADKPDADQHSDNETLTEEEIRSRELYRYLTENDPTKLRSLEVTPSQSSEESDSDSSEGSGSTEKMDSSDSEQDAGSDSQHVEAADLEGERKSRKGKPYAPEKRMEVTKYAIQVGAIKASKLYNIPRSTIRQWVKQESTHPRGNSGIKLGRPLTYPVELETEIKDYVIQQNENGIGVTREDLTNYGKGVIEAACPDFKASRSWLLAFMKRHQLVCEGQFIKMGTEGEEGEYSGSGEEDQDMEQGEPVKVRRKPGPKPRHEKTPKKPKLEPGQLSLKTLEKLEKSKEVTDKWLKDLEVPKDILEKPMTFDILNLNQYLTCGLCKGYLYEASTITECMHTFCKNCIVRHCMEVSLHCPVCNILIHPTDPFIHIRLDRMIQDIVYKILPNVAETEMKNIEEFYEAHPEVEPKEIHEPPSKPRVSPRDKETKPPKPEPQLVSLLLESEEDECSDMEELQKKFVRVNSAATVDNVCNFLRRKLNLHDEKEIELFCCGDSVEERSSTLENIKHKFFGEEECLMLLQYRVRDT